MAKSSTKFSENDRINHQGYGSGTITSIYDSYTVINFDQHGQKRFVSELLQMEHSDVPAPPTRKKAQKTSKSKK